MKKVLFAVLLMFPAVVVFAAEKEAGPMKSANLKKVDQTLIEMDSTVSRLNQLDRRMSDLERDIRDQRDRVRYIERDVNDLKRRTYANSQDY